MRLLFGGILVLTLAVSPLAKAQEPGTTSSSFWFYNPEQAAKLREEMKSDPVNEKKVEANINKVAERVKELHPTILNSVKADFKEKNRLIYNSLVVSMVATSPFFRHLGLALEVSDDRFFGFKRDTISINGKLGINGYQRLKEYMAHEVGGDQLASADFKKQAKESCDTALSVKTAKDLEGTAMLSFGYCVFVHQVLESKNFSDFLVQSAPFVRKFKKLSKELLDEKYGWWTILTGYGLKICTKNDYSCWGQYLYGKASFTAGVGRIAGAFTLKEESIEVEMSYFTFRTISEFLAGGQSSATEIDLIKYYVVKQIERMDADQIESAARSISDLIASTEKSLAEAAKPPEAAAGAANAPAQAPPPFPPPGPASRPLL